MLPSREAPIRGLRRLGRALTGSLSAGDALVAETMPAYPRRQRAARKTLADMIARHRQDARPEGAANCRTPPHPAPTGFSSSDDLGPREVMAAFDALPLQAREILALVVAEDLPYETAASILDIPLSVAMARLTVARTMLDCLIHGQNPMPLRLVQ